MSGTNEALTAFTAGDLVISVDGDDNDSGTYTDNQAAPIALEEITTTGTVVGADGAAADHDRRERRDRKRHFRRIWLVVGGLAAALGRRSVAGHHGLWRQRPDLQRRRGRGLRQRRAGADRPACRAAQYTAVARVVADISYNGTVDTSTALYNVVNTNNPRSVATVNGTVVLHFRPGREGRYHPGCFRGAVMAPAAPPRSTPAPTRAPWRSSTASSMSRATARRVRAAPSNIEMYGTTLPTGATVGTVLTGIDGTITLTAAQENGINNARRRPDASISARKISSSPRRTFSTSPTAAIPRRAAWATAACRNGFSTASTWILAYTLSAGLNLVAGYRDVRHHRADRPDRDRGRRRRPTCMPRTRRSAISTRPISTASPTRLARRRCPSAKASPQL